MNKLIAVLTLPLSLAGSIAVVLKFYALTSSAQLASAEMIRAASQLSLTIPKLILYFGLLTIMIAVAYAIGAFASSGARRVNAQTEVVTRSALRLADANSVVGRRLLHSGYTVVGSHPQYDIIAPKEHQQ